MDSENIIEVKGLVKKYGEKNALDGIDMTVRKGEMYAFLGPNGAGKTTTVRVLSTLTGFDAGTVKINGFDSLKNPIEAKGSIGVIQQQISLDKDLTVWENMMVHALYHKIPRAERKKRIDELADYIGLREYYNRSVNSLSGGWKKKVAIVCALIDKPKILFLDEPTVGLDIQSRRSLWDLLRKLNDDGMTIFLTTHYIEEAESLCTRISIINSGKIIAEDTPENLSKRLGAFTVEHYGSDRKTQYHYFNTKDEADAYSKSLPDDVTVTLRRTNLSDCFVELTGNQIEANGSMMKGESKKGGMA
ncbi:MAG: ABC transporter ATP-binding protein [Candidatus Methanomethylophilus sp.]|nr:ABC transporter ATP-binding protein [Methanomethylophilus sp.]